MVTGPGAGTDLRRSVRCASRDRNAERSGAGWSIGLFWAFDRLIGFGQRDCLAAWLGVVAGWSGHWTA